MTRDKSGNTKDNPTKVVAFDSDGDHHQHPEVEDEGVPAKKPLSASEKSKDDWRYVLKTLIAGGIAGSVAKTVIGPFDRVKILFQTKNPHYQHKAGTLTGVFHVVHDIYKKDGIFALYRGHSTMLARIFPYAAIQYMSYEQFKIWLKVDQTHHGSSASNSNSQSPPKREPWRLLTAGSLAGMCSVAVTYPLDTLRARMAAQVKSHEQVSLFKLVKTMMAEGPFPFSSYYRGFMPTIYGIIPYAGVSFFTYESLKKIVIAHHQTRSASNGEHWDHKQLGPVERLVCGAVAGATAQTVAYPLDVVRRRFQLAHVYNHISRKPSTIATLFHVIRNEGVSGLFVGLSVNYIKVAPATGVSFLVYETIKGWMDI